MRTEGQILLTLMSVNDVYCMHVLRMHVVRKLRLSVCACVRVFERTVALTHARRIAVTRSKCGPLTSNNSRIKKFLDILDLIIEWVF